MRRHFRLGAQVAVGMAICVLIAIHYVNQTAIFCPEGETGCAFKNPAWLENYNMTETSVSDAVPTDSSTAETITESPENPSTQPETVEEKPVEESRKSEPVNRERLVAETISAIMVPSLRSSSQLQCPPLQNSRYGYLAAKPSTTSTEKSSELTSSRHLRSYFIALDLFECAPLLPTLMGTVVDVIKYLGPENCVVSIVEGRSKDGTREILSALRKQIVDLGAEYHLTFNEINPKGEGVNRIVALSGLRNQALNPLVDNPQQYSPDTSLIYINDIALCPEDVLELLHQHKSQDMDMTCAMDWINDGTAFYDVWVSRSMTGDIFFEITQGVDWKYSQNLFWDHATSKERYHAKQPVQVYACWKVVKQVRGSVSDNLQHAFQAERENGTKEKITWEEMPAQVKCLPIWEEISWVKPI